jgi:prepilin-type N-terminal cleavage/methylation domain-containing protein
VKYWQLKSNKQGFTLIEILVVVAIVSLLSGVVAVSSIQSGQKSRDAKRQADLQALQSAVELYKNKNGRYPAGCNGVDTWAGQLGTDYACTNGSTQYITGLAPEFIPVLPLDKKLNTTNSGYIYRVNADGTVYKIKAHRTVESEVVTYTHEFKPCDIRVASLAGGSLNSGSSDREVIGWCGRVRAWAWGSPVAAPPSTCRVDTGNLDFTGSYGVWGGFKATSTVADLPRQVFDTTVVICR